MELDELKDLWRKNDAGFRPRGEVELASMLKRNSSSLVGKLKRSVWFELIFTLVSGLLLLIYALTLPSGALKWTSVSILAIFVAYTVYYIKKLMLLNAFDTAGETLRVNLEKLIGSLSSYLKFYRRSFTLLYPVYFIAALVFGAIEKGFTEFMHALTAPKAIVFLLVVAVVFYIASTWLVNWILQKLYGKHLDKLRDILVDLKSESN